LAEEEGDDEENEVKVQLKDCPEAVQKTIKKEAGSGKIREIEKEREGGKTVYEAEVIIDGKEYEITVAEDGKVLGKEEEGAEDDDDADDDDKKGGDTKKAAGA
jgi:uncharacterized membrane protein YkoI